MTFKKNRAKACPHAHALAGEARFCFSFQKMLRKLINRPWGNTLVEDHYYHY
jgi:hypothetical protein